MTALLHRILLFIFSLSLIASPTWAGVFMLGESGTNAAMQQTMHGNHQMSAGLALEDKTAQIMTAMLENPMSSKASTDAGNHCQGHECHSPATQMVDCNDDNACKEMSCATVAIVESQKAEFIALAQPSIISFYTLSLAGTSKNLIRPPIA